MRSSITRRRHHEEEEESAFVSMTDLTVGFLFIVILLLAFFASQYSEIDTVPRDKYDSVKKMLDQTVQERDFLVIELEDTKKRIAELETELAQLKMPDPLEVYINSSLAERRRILVRLRDAIQADFPDFEINLSEESDALRFQGDGLFRSGAANLRPDRRTFVESVAARLQEILPCYTLGDNDKHPTSLCNAGAALIEAVQIEGHTDSDGEDMMNLMLSTARANETFRVMVEKEPNLVDHLNFRGQPVLSVSGYGEMRPVATNETTAGKDSNRRIDLRIIMYVPSHSKEIDAIRAALGADTLTEEAK